MTPPSLEAAGAVTSKAASRAVVTLTTGTTGASKAPSRAATGKGYLSKVGSLKPRLFPLNGICPKEQVI